MTPQHFHQTNFGMPDSNCAKKVWKSSHRTSERPLAWDAVAEIFGASKMVQKLLEILEGSKCSRLMTQSWDDKAIV